MATFPSPPSPSSSSSIPSPRSSMFYYARSENHYEEPHFLQACFLCRKPLGQNRDIFMYREHTILQQRCRQEQIEIDDAKEKTWKLSSKRGVRQSENSQNNSTTNKAVRTGTVAVA
ncbi:hypothetical protein LR48_Vigan11g160400 [Vigna angularis]|uniref:FLZ-type domain-containing protein n=1 Tax=Phaseolus angularis TaxID=3914 RepID=A0A0L9VU23_PHAAN|nr:hypothetical protein LR48_Vigan11g160400 [Vigna angularis]